ncbi:putative peptidase S49, ClpP/crotonase-like domain-containing protein [Medicago truncatula]|uniref:Putative peptidase S49, ClpP/crotonase-like domain-containing protein n=1 Tax=Medicago truncatula TaxID=3880 RepID=A0A396II17_MEDTR|nr:putative peptidase S49, ClpP/crotonase-like domain-containing protein [Medicago truncatula]
MGAGYYVAMGAGVIVAENLTLTGSIGVDLGIFSLENMYKLIEWEEFTSWGTYKYHTADTEAFAERARHMYIYAALSRSMTIDKMEEVAQGRIWTSKDAVSHGLVDAIGGLSRAIAIAKLKANIPQNRQVTLVERSIPSPNLPEVVRDIGYPLYDGRVWAHCNGAPLAIGYSLVGWRDFAHSNGVPLRMDGTMRDFILFLSSSLGGRNSTLNKKKIVLFFCYYDSLL